MEKFYRSDAWKKGKELIRALALPILSFLICVFSWILTESGISLLGIIVLLIGIADYIQNDVQI